MTGSLRLALPFLLAYLAWRLSSWYPRAMRFCTAVLAGMLLGGLVVLVVTAVGRQQWAWPVGVHRWAGHALVIEAWLAIPWAIGVILQQHLRKRPFRAMLGVACCLLTLFFIVVASFTGYLNGFALPANVPAGEFGVDLSSRFAGEETRNRFVVLHVYAVPYLIALSLAGWFIIASFPPRTRAA